MTAALGPLALPLAALAGAAVAALDLALLRANVRLYLAGGGVALPLALHALRVLATAGALVGLALLGAPALVAALAAFTAVRLSWLALLRGPRRPAWPAAGGRPGRAP